jgi:hypothetical protein
VFCASFFSSFVVTSSSKNGSADFHDLYVKRRVSRKEVPFLSPNASKNFQWVQFPPKAFKFGLGIWISSFNKTVNNVSTVHAIFARISSIGTDWQKKSKISTERQKFCSRCHFLGQTPPMGISSQNTMLNNFSPVKLILIFKKPNDVRSTTANTKDHQTFSKFNFRGVMGEIPKITLLNNL